MSLNDYARQIRNETRRDNILFVDRGQQRIGCGKQRHTQPESRFEMMQALRRLAMPGNHLHIAIGMEQYRETQIRERLITAAPSPVTAVMLRCGWIAGTDCRRPALAVALRELMAQTKTNRARAMAERDR
jgi:hypothetical protein